uniref:Putative Gag-polypeptide of LTR copia-type n=1 Tax=Tanacetum cinerariifolium TaxID=118510 RepID=A0A699GID3_TANCI|nr:putative Gag-polypeptide of LTR copia-type [Tanacetum cinerariifolium]
MVVTKDVSKSGDDANKHTHVSSSSELNLSFGDTSYLHPNDTGSSSIVTIKLTGTENYKLWSIAMTFSLKNHNKLGFIDGSCKKENNNSDLANQWDMCNSVVVTWILNSLSPDLFVGAIYAKTAYVMWKDLKDTYDKVNGSDVFNLHKNINSLIQNDAGKHFEKHNQLIKLMLFLMGLEKSYLEIKCDILTKEPLPLVKVAFAVVSDEESHMNATSIGVTKPTATAFVAKTFDNKIRFNNNNNKGSGSNTHSNNRGRNPNIKCTNCNKIGHIIDRCFELVGYPTGYVKKNFNANTKLVSSNNAFASADVHSNNMSSNNDTTSNYLVSLSNEQLARLMSLLNNNGILTANANMAEYVVSLLSVHRLVRDSKLFVAFDESNCYIQDLRENMTVGIDIQCAGSDTRPPMLDRTDFSSWQQRIRLYCLGKENGVNILKSIYEGPFQMGIVQETLAEGTEGAPHLGPERPRVYSDLSPEENDRYNVDIRATNVLLQRLPNDIYTLINHYTDAKDIWDNVKMLLEGSKLTKEDRESQLMQLNSKFVNNMLPEWDRFVTVVKLNRRLRDSNYDQLYAYLKQREAHANENKMMSDRFSQHTVDPLALMSNVSHQQHYLQSSTTPPSTYVPPYLANNAHLDSGLSATDNLIRNLTNRLSLFTQSYKTFLPQTNNQVKTSSNTRN